MALKKENRPLLPILASVTLSVCLVALACTTTGSTDSKPRSYSPELRVTPLSESCSQLLARAKAVEDDYYAALNDPDTTNEQLNLAISFNLEIIQRLVDECPREQATRIATNATQTAPMQGEPTATIRGPISGSDSP